MADAAWAELQAGESGARDKAWDRILKKNAVAKKAKKKRPPKRWEPPVAPVAAKEEEPAKPPAPPETAVALLRRLARAVQQTAAEDSKVRSEGLDTLSKALTQNLPDATVAELLHSLCQPLLRRFEDPVEKLREKAIRLMAELCKKSERLATTLTVPVPRFLHHRGSPASGLDVENSVFVFDLQGYDEFKRGKAHGKARPPGSVRKDTLSQLRRARRGAALTIMRVTYCSDDEPTGQYYWGLPP